MKNDVFLGFCRLVNVATGFSAVLCLVAHALAVAAGPSFSEPKAAQLQVLRVYGVLISAGLAILETEWQLVLGCCRILESWVIRGLCQAFLSVLTLQLVTSEGDSDFDKSVRLYRTVAGMCMLGCAGFYMLGGILCIGYYKNARHRRQLERVRVARDIESLEKQREELGRLLAAYSKE